MTRRWEIVDAIAREGMVEEIVRNILRRSRLTPTMEDGCQLVYEYLLHYDEAKLADLWANGQIAFFLVGIIKRQFCTNDSRHYREHRRFTNQADEVREDLPGVPR